MNGNLYIVSAPSGAGKTSLVAALLNADAGIRGSISYTTRQPRPGEIHGTHYHFVSSAEFQEVARTGGFLESAQVHGNSYGTSKQWVENQLATGIDIVLEIDWQGAEQIRQIVPTSISIFILPPSLDTLEKRLFSRGQDDATVIARRTAAARAEIAHVTDFNYVIINDDFAVAAAELQTIVRAERLRSWRQLQRHGTLINQLNQPL
jgi:guanylate kinase